MILWQIAKTVGGGKTGSRCEALFRKHQGYLSIPRVHHSEVAWWAMVQDSMLQDSMLQDSMANGDAPKVLL